MFIFHRVQQTHAGRLAVPGAGRAAQARKRFIGAFRGMTEKVAGPLFEQFAHDMQARGYAAHVKAGADVEGNPYLALTLIPDVGARAGADSARECVCQLKAVPAEHVVECASCHDQRPGNDGPRMLKAGLESVSRDFLVTWLEEFLTAALESRASS